MSCSEARAREGKPATEERHAGDSMVMDGGSLLDL